MMLGMRIASGTASGMLLVLCYITLHIKPLHAHALTRMMLGMRIASGTASGRLLML
jgi:hypothetical protein